ncbi:hypothetical protein BCR36DRAFT_411814 [Piromyces finnis]|uniref:Uncharacterized protein n=1 Tax=Piromyces finnis TaxID=1754191 RepID=A0A1Y1VBL6_9FUNG|nr:hypothetical protein BCR36DRAFT_411814 [Piromyces finnis]|eukprot:ORX51864.1 hypothetical protein BCR36DRAFT_411814 [Piromyces finnis]
MDNTNNKIILKELVLLCKNCNSLEDNILEIGTVCFPENNYKRDIIKVNQRSTLDSHVKNIKLVNSKISKILTYSNTLLAKFRKYKIGNRDIDFKALTKNANVNAKVRMRRKTDSLITLRKSEIDSRSPKNSPSPVSINISKKIDNKNLNGSEEKIKEKETRKNSGSEKGKIKDINVSKDKNKDKDSRDDKEKIKENQKDNIHNIPSKFPEIHPLVKGILSTCKSKTSETEKRTSHSRKPSIVDKNILNNKDAKSLNDRLTKIKEKSQSTNSVIDDTQKFIENLKKKLEETTLKTSELDSTDDHRKENLNNEEENKVVEKGEEKEEEEKEKIINEKEKCGLMKNESSGEKINKENNCKINSSTESSPTRKSSKDSVKTKKETLNSSLSELSINSLDSEEERKTNKKQSKSINNKLINANDNINKQQKELLNRDSSIIDINNDDNGSGKQSLNNLKSISVDDNSNEKKILNTKLENSDDVANNFNNETCTTNAFDINSKVVEVEKIDILKTKTENNKEYTHENEEKLSVNNKDEEATFKLALTSKQDLSISSMRSGTKFREQNEELKKALFDLFKQYDNLNQMINELKNDNNLLLENQFAQNELIKEYEYEIQILMLKTQQQDIYPYSGSNELEYYEESLINSEMQQQQQQQQLLTDNSLVPLEEQLSDQTPHPPSVSQQQILNETLITESLPDVLDYSTIGSSGSGGHPTIDYSNINTNEIESFIDGKNTLGTNELPLIEPIPKLMYNIPSCNIEKNERLEADSHLSTSTNRHGYPSLNIRSDNIVNDQMVQLTSTLNDQSGPLSSEKLTIIETSYNKEERIRVGNEEDENNISKRLDLLEARITNEVTTLDPISNMNRTTAIPISLTSYNNQEITVNSFHPNNSTWLESEVEMNGNCLERPISTLYANEEYLYGYNDEILTSPYLSLKDDNVSQFSTIQSQSSIDRYTIGGNEFEPMMMGNDDGRSLLFQNDNNSSYARSIYSNHGNEGLDSHYPYSQDQENSNDGIYNRSFYFSSTNDMELHTPTIPPHSSYKEDVINSQLFQSIIDKQKQITDIDINIQPPTTPFDTNHMNYSVNVDFSKDNDKDHYYSLQNSSIHSPPHDFPLSTQRYPTTSALTTSSNNTTSSFGAVLTSQAQNQTISQNPSVSNNLDDLHRTYPKPKPIITSYHPSTSSNKSPTHSISQSSYYKNYPLSAMAALGSSPSPPHLISSFHPPWGWNEVKERRSEPVSAYSYNSNDHPSSSPSLSAPQKYTQSHGNGNTTSAYDSTLNSIPSQLPILGSSILTKQTLTSDDHQDYSFVNKNGENNRCDATMIQTDSNTAATAVNLNATLGNNPNNDKKLDFNLRQDPLEEEYYSSRHSIPNQEVFITQNNNELNYPIDGRKDLGKGDKSPLNISSSTNRKINDSNFLSINTTNIMDNNISFSSNYTDNLATPTNAVPFPSNFPNSQI